MPLPVTRYAKSGDVHVAYQVFGNGPVDLVFVPGFVSHIENYWEHPDLARWLLRLGASLAWSCSTSAEQVCPIPSLKFRL